MRTVIVPPGIGDSLWVLMKLLNSGEQFRFILPNVSPQRGKQVFDLLPQIAVSAEYQDFITYKKVEMASIHRTAQLFRNVKRQEFCLSANGWLEEGKRIEGFLPDLDTSYRLEYATTAEDAAKADQILYKGLDDKDRYPCFGIYASAYSNARHWDGWDAVSWVTYCQAISKAHPRIVFVLIGAEYDTDLSQQIMEGLAMSSIPYISSIGQPLPVVVEILKRLVYFTGFPSGLSILNETLGMDGTMFYPRVKKAVANIMGTWADPKRLADNSFKECLFPHPEEMAQWVLQEYGLLNRVSDGKYDEERKEAEDEIKAIIESEQEQAESGDDLSKNETTLKEEADVDLSSAKVVEEGEFFAEPPKTTTPNQSKRRRR